MEKYYSKTNQSWLLLHIIHRKDDIVAEREDVVPEEQFLQMAAMKLPIGKTFKPHKHILKTIVPAGLAGNFLPNSRAQESWVVISGKIKCILYDIDDTILAEPILEPGDCSITLMGGHNYLALEPSVVREFKTGPYEGQTKDKIFI